MVCHSLLLWTTFCQTSPAWPVCFGWPDMAWLCFIELDKAVVRVIRLASFLWVWFQCICPLMPSCNTYHVMWVSLTLDVGYLFMAPPAKSSCCQWVFTIWCRQFIPGALWQPRAGGVGWEMEGRFKREGTYGYLWLSHAAIRQKPAHVVKQLSSN